MSEKNTIAHEDFPGTFEDYFHGQRIVAGVPQDSTVNRVIIRQGNALDVTARDTSIFIGNNRIERARPPTQLDRIEEKLDRLIALLEIRPE